VKDVILIGLTFYQISDWMLTRQCDKQNDNGGFCIDQENAIVHQLDPETQFGAVYPYRPQIEGYIYGNYLFKCCTQIKYA
jgi:hypothetical protein